MSAPHASRSARSYDVMAEIFSGETTPAQLGALLTAMRMRGESEAEIAGMARVMRERAVQVTARFSF